MDKFLDSPKWVKVLLIVFLGLVIIILAFSLYGGHVLKNQEESQNTVEKNENKIKKDNQVTKDYYDLDFDEQNNLQSKIDSVNKKAKNKDTISHDVTTEGDYTTVYDKEKNPVLLVKASNVEGEIGDAEQKAEDRVITTDAGLIIYFTNLSNTDYVLVEGKSYFKSSNGNKYKLDNIHYLEYKEILANDYSEIAVNIKNTSLDHKIKYEDNSNRGSMKLYVMTKEDFLDKKYDNIKFIINTDTKDTISESKKLQ